jgi:hypothetical protein
MVASISGDGSTTEDYEELLAAQKNNFWLAYRALDLNKPELMRLGIELTKKIQHLIVQEGISLVEKNEVKPAGHFRVVTMNKDNTRDQRFF